MIVVQHVGTGEDAAVESVIERHGARRVQWSGAFNFAAMNNRAARESTGEVLLFLNDDVAPIEPEWLARMVAHLNDTKVGVVGALLMYPDGAIQHAGIATWLINGAGHPGRNLRECAHWPWLRYTREVTAVTGACLAVRRADFERIGGFDEGFPVNFNDVDLCLRFWKAGLKVVLETGAVLRHEESRSRKPGTEYNERRRFFELWAPVVTEVDQYYSPFLAQNNEDLSLRVF